MLYGQYCERGRAKRAVPALGITRVFGARPAMLRYLRGVDFNFVSKLCFPPFTDIDRGGYTIMTRKTRSLALNICHHVMLRGIDGEVIFKDKNDFFRLYLMLQKAAEVHGFQIHAFCFMPNHMHLIIKPLTTLLEICVHAFAARYAQFYNRKYKRRGYLFQGRFRSIVVSDGIYLQRLVRYIHLNPVEAKIVSRPEDYPWSSHKAYMGHTDYTWLKKDFVLQRFGRNAHEGTKNLLKFISNKVEAEADLEQIHAAFAAGAYGDKAFHQEHVEEPLVTPEKLISSALDIEQIIEKVTTIFEVTPEQLAGSSRLQKLVNARSVLALFARKVSNLSLYDVSRALNKNNGTISRLATRAESFPELRTLVDDLLEKN
jgi:putative transposase